ncbi:hypothetical protein [Paenibacillus chitinolyticus]|uniref:hypothetical protein n=1 Tax=Paenibacillus chitinolyticus TaxID=79263 RepID=UPI003644E83F
MQIDWYRLALWLTLAFINLGFAQIKSMNARFWFLISLIIGPVATVLIVTKKKEANNL